jgi:hypothetical protein
VPSYNPVYSAPLILYTDDTPNTSFLVPAGFTAIIRQVVFWNQVADNYFICFLFGAGASEGVVFAAFTGISLNSAQQWEGRVVAPEGYTIECESGGLATGTTIYVGGYLLRNTLS